MITFSEWQIINTYTRMGMLVQILNVVQDEPQLTGAGIGKRVGYAQSTVNAALNDMQTMGWVQRDRWGTTINQRGIEILNQWRASQEQEAA